MRGAALARVLGGADQQVGDPRLALRAALEQVAGDDVGVGAVLDELAGRLAVEALALGLRQVGRDGDADQAVGEALPARGQQAGRHERVTRRRERAGRDAGRGGDDVLGGAVADHGQRRHDRAVARGERREATADDTARDGRDGRDVALRLVERVGPVRGDLPAELAEQPGVAVDHAVAVAADVDRRARRRAVDELDRAGRGQRLRVQERRRAHAAEQAEEVGRGVGIVGADADEDQQRQVGDPAGEVGEHLERRAVGPLRVVDHERDRTLVGERRAQPEDAVRDRHRGVVAGHAPVEQQLARGVRGAVEQLVALDLRRVAQRAFEQRPHHAEREVTFERSRGRAAHEATGRAGQVDGVVEQCRLAEAGRGLEHHHAPVALSQALYRLFEDVELHGSLQKRSLGGRRVDVW